MARLGRRFYPRSGSGSGSAVTYTVTYTGTGMRRVLLVLPQPTLQRLCAGKHKKQYS